MHNSNYWTKMATKIIHVSLDACLGPMQRMGMNYNCLGVWVGLGHWESRFLNPRKSKTHLKIVKLGVVSRRGTYMSRNFFVHFGASFITSLLQTGASLKKPRGSDRETCPPCGQNVITASFHLVFLLRATWNDKISVLKFKLIQGSFGLFIH